MLSYFIATGKDPYYHKKRHRNMLRLIEHVRKGLRLASLSRCDFLCHTVSALVGKRPKFPKPSNVTAALREVIEACWNANACERLNARSLLAAISKLEEEHGEGAKPGGVVSHPESLPQDLATKAKENAPASSTMNRGAEEQLPADTAASRSAESQEPHPANVSPTNGPRERNNSAVSNERRDDKQPQRTNMIAVDGPRNDRQPPTDAASNELAGQSTNCILSAQQEATT